MDSFENELQIYQNILSSDRITAGTTPSDRFSDELATAPLIWWDVKKSIDDSAAEGKGLQQYAVMGHVPDQAHNGESHPVFLNTNSPWSAFLCGSQGSGKSHALSCMLENCLLADRQIGKNEHPLAGLVFHYDRTQGSGVCEAAYLCSSIPTTVLVSPSNYQRLKQQYEEMAGRFPNANIEVQALRLLPTHLDTERMKTLMAVSKDGEMPLYMHLLIKLLRDLALETGGSAAFDYEKFTSKLDEQVFSDRQNAPLKMRLDLLESFLKLPPKPEAVRYTLGKSSGKGKTSRPAVTPKPDNDHIVGQAGQLTIIDLTDPVIDSDLACVLFNICLSVFIAQTKCSKIVALDEAHNYMTEGGSSAVNDFTEKLLKTIREQRHQATRVVIATQEPTINTRLLDLCSITMVHRCTSPAWFAVLKKHVAGLFLSEDGNQGSGMKEIDRTLFQRIVQLEVGESLLFCPTAAVGIEGGKIKRMVSGLERFKTRKRVTEDGGKTKLAVDN